MFSNGAHGFISRDLAEVVLSVDGSLIPRIGWLIQAGGAFSLSETSVLTLLWLLLLLSGCALVFGICSRTAAVTGWLIHLAAVGSAQMMSYGMDNFTTIGLFYLAIGPLPDPFSYDARQCRYRVKSPRIHGFFRRVLQIHLCFIYFFSGIAKCAGPGWWNGVSIWRALTRPPFDIVPTTLLASYSHFFPLVGIATCIVETAYPIMIWPRRTRFAWLSLVVLLHASIAVMMGLYLFAIIMIVLNLSAFAPELFARLPLLQAPQNRPRIPARRLPRCARFQA